jgi:hypothetical protein
MNLVIHPSDPSTSFLKPIYGGITDKTIVEKNSDAKKLHELIEKSDRVMAMGHGSPNGLFSMGLFSGTRYRSFYALGDDHADILRGKDQNVYIWCHADKFVDFHDLNGFYSGMFISEMGEAYFCGILQATDEMVTESNNAFSEIVGEHISLPKEKLYEKVRELYGKLAKSNPVAQYNLDKGV